MRNSSIHRANLSDEKIAFLSELKNQKEAEKMEDNAPKAYKRTGKQKELDMLWQSFITNPKEEKSPGVYLLTGFVAGALSMFLMNAVLSIGSNLSNQVSDTSLGQPKFEKKISRKNKLPQIANVPAVEIVPVSNKTPAAEQTPKMETYTVKSGDSISYIVTRFYGSYDLDKVERIKQVNNMPNVHKLSIGQELIIPLD